MGTAMELYKKKMAEKAEKYAHEEKSGSSYFTTQGGVLKFGDEELPGNEMLVIVLDAIHENTYFEGAFDPDVMLPPTCFAFGRSEKEMQPHENVPDPDEDSDSYFEMQTELDDDGDPWCDECPFSQWGSADKGRGKKCGNKRRLALIPAGRFIPGKTRRDSSEMELFEEIEQFEDAEIAFLKLPVTSTKAWANYVHKLNKDHQAPPFAVYTHIWIEPDEKNAFKVCFDMIEVVEDEDLIEVLFKRNEDAEDVIEQPYAEPSPEELEQPKSKAKKGLSGLRKKRRDR